jgi:hypothetical protein
MSLHVILGNISVEAVEIAKYSGGELGGVCCAATLQFERCGTDMICIKIKELQASTVSCPQMHQPPTCTIAIAYGKATKLQSV